MATLLEHYDYSIDFGKEKRDYQRLQSLIIHKLERDHTEKMKTAALVKAKAPGFGAAAGQCNNWQKHGKCSLGDACPYSAAHTPEPRGSQMKKKSRKNSTSSNGSKSSNRGRSAGSNRSIGSEQQIDQSKHRRRAENRPDGPDDAKPLGRQTASILPCLDDPTTRMEFP